MILNEEEAFAYLRKFCEERKIPYSRAESQFHMLGEDFALLCVPNPDAPEPDGLANDIDTLMLPTLYIRKKNGIYTAEETEFTERFLLYCT